MSFISRLYHIKTVYINGEYAVSVTKYQDGTLAVVLMGEEDREVISVNLSSYGLVPKPDEFYVKNYAEHTGLAVALVEAGIAKKVSLVTYGPFASTSAWLLRLAVKPAAGRI